MKNPTYSIVVPAYNEEECLPYFFEKVIPLFEKTGEEFEIIIVNDGSKDRTEEIIKEQCEKDSRITGISFSRNFGQQAAFLAGLKEAKGQAVIAMDADLQDPPEVALQMIEKWKEGFDIVHGRRKSRPKESFFKKATARLYYKFLHRISYAKVPENVGDFKLYSRKAVDAIISLPEHDRLLRAQAAWVGFKQTFIDFDRPAREIGETKYTLKKMVKLASDGIISNSDYPLTLALKSGILLSVLSLACFITFIVLAATGVMTDLLPWLFPTIGALFGWNLTVKGLSDIYTARIYNEVKNRPVYIIKEKFHAEREDNTPDRKHSFFSLKK